MGHSEIMFQSITQLATRYTSTLMPKRPDQMEEYATECRRRAAAVKDPALKKTFNEIARQWEELADLHRRMEADQEIPRLPP